ncbi:MAG: hypothetical protein WCT77_12980, partial [Bacteroidota bacterium]
AYFDYERFFSKKKNASFNLILNYILNNNDKDIRIYYHLTKHSINALYNKLEKILDKYYNKDKKELKKIVEIEFEEFLKITLPYQERLNEKSLENSK